MSIRFFNAQILDFKALESHQNHQEYAPALTWGEVWVEGEDITFVGPNPPSGKRFLKNINLNGNLLLPGFKNAHAHAPMVFLRSFADDLPLQDWLNHKVFPVEAQLKPQDSLLFSKIAFLEYLTSGITASFEMYIHPYEVAQAALDMGFRTVLCGAVNNHIHSPRELFKQHKDLNSLHPTISMLLGFHGEYTTSTSIITEIAAFAKAHQLPVYTHLSETKREVDSCIKAQGTTPPLYLDSLGIWDYGGGGFHGVHMSKEDLDLFEKKKLSLVTNPGSNSKLASGIAPLTEILERKIPLALGTDGAASNNSLDFFREMYLMTVLQKLGTENPAAFPPHQVLNAAFLGGAHVMNLHHCREIKAGQKADLIVIDLNQPNMQPIHDPLTNLVYSGSKSNVELTMINGQILLHKGEFFTKENPEQLYALAAQRLKKFTS